MSIGILVSTLPELENVSLAGNQLSSFSELNSFSPVVGGASSSSGSSKPGLNHLRELILRGNPIRTNAEKDSGVGYQEYLMEACRRFPSLQILDGEAIDPAIRSQIPQVTRPQIPVLPDRPSSSIPEPLNAQASIGPEPPLPLPIKPAFFDDASTSNVITSFCNKFFQALDQDRSLLLDVYSNEASFSLSGSFYIPVRAKCAGLTRNSKEMPAQQVVNWNTWMELSRNLAKMRGNS